VESAEPIEPVFSPDRRWIAYTSSPVSTGFSPDRGVFIQPFPATGTRYQLPKQQVDFHPLWSPDGHELIFTPSAASGRLAAVPVTIQPTVTFGPATIFPAEVTAERLSADTRAFDILPDGRFVGLIGNPGPDVARPSGAQLRVVFDWFEDVKQRVPTN
jgi:hypothetical protein